MASAAARPRPEAPPVTMNVLSCNVHREPSEYNEFILMKSYDQHYYDGAWQPSTSADTIDVISSATEAAVGRVPRGSAEDVDRAVKAARRGFESWSRVPLEERAQWLEKLAAAMKPRVPEVAEAIAHEVGTALRTRPRCRWSSRSR